MVDRCSAMDRRSPTSLSLLRAAGDCCAPRCRAPAAACRNCSDFPQRLEFFGQLPINGGTWAYAIPRTRFRERLKMQDSPAHYVALGFALIAALAGIAGAQKARGSFRS